jgi:hypothetical protein
MTLSLYIYINIILNHDCFIVIYMHFSAVTAGAFVKYLYSAEIPKVDQFSSEVAFIELAINLYVTSLMIHDS